MKHLYIYTQREREKFTFWVLRTEGLEGSIEGLEAGNIEEELDRECFERERDDNEISIGETKKGKVCIFGWREMRMI